MLLNESTYALSFYRSQNDLCWHINQFYWMQIIFLSCTKCLWLPHYINKFLDWYKKFGLAKNILGPVKGQGNSIFSLPLNNWRSNFETVFVFQPKSDRAHLSMLWPSFTKFVLKNARFWEQLSFKILITLLS